MAFIKCSGGGKLKDTILWRNPNGATENFPAQSVGLDYPYTNFDYLEFKWDRTKEITYGGKIIVTKDFFDTCLKSDKSGYRVILDGFVKDPSATSGNSYQRVAMRNTDAIDSTLNVYFGLAYAVGAANEDGSGISSKGYTIPTRIIGWKY